MRLNFHKWKQNRQGVASLNEFIQFQQELSTVEVKLFFRLVAMTFFIFFSKQTLANSSLSLNACSTVYNGAVTLIEKSSAPSYQIPMQKIKLYVQKMIRGIEQESFYITIPEGINYKFKIGEQLKVVSHEGYVCNIERI